MKYYVLMDKSNVCIYPVMASIVISLIFVGLKSYFYISYIYNIDCSMMTVYSNYACCAYNTYRHVSLLHDMCPGFTTYVTASLPYFLTSLISHPHASSAAAAAA